MTAAQLTAPRSGQRHPAEDAVADYLREIGRAPLLTREQEVALAAAIEVGVLASEALARDPESADMEDLRTLAVLGEEARHSLIRANLRLVVSIAKRHLGRGLAMLDLVQEGNLGLMRAVERFDHRLGFKFSTFGVWWIKQAIMRAVADQGRAIRIPAHVSDEVYRAGRRKLQLGEQWGRPPTTVELAIDLDVSAQRVQDLLGWARQPSSLDAAVNDGGASLADLVSDEGPKRAYEQVVEDFVRADLASAMSGLNERESALLTMRFGLRGTRPHTLDEVATNLGVSRERIRQLQSRAMSKLRAGSNSDTLRSYLR